MPEFAPARLPSIVARDGKRTAGASAPTKFPIISRAKSGMTVRMNHLGMAQQRHRDAGRTENVIAIGAVFLWGSIAAPVSSRC
jgi:hypothetical protein